MRTVLSFALATLLVAASFPLLAAEAAAPPASLSRELARAVATGDPADEVDVIVRLHDFATEDDARALRAKGLMLTSALTTVPAYGATTTLGAVTALSRDPRVAHLELDLPIHYTMSVAARETRARDVWDPLTGGEAVVVGGQLVDGTGVGVAVVDSGIDATHPDLEWGTHVQKNYFRTVAVANTLFGTDGETPPFVPDAANFVDVPDSDMTSGHGTHVAGIVGGSGAVSGGLHKGAAPGATIYGFGMGQGLSILAPNEAFDYILRNFDSFDPPIKVVTNSYGSCGDRWDPESLTSVLVGEFLARDVNVIWAAGNIDATCSDIHGGGAADDPRPGFIGVANYDGSGVVSRDATVSDSSSQGFEDEPPSMWPDLAAPGTSITSTGASTGAVALAPHDYATISGTSMATPHVAGVVALVRQANPDLTAAEVEQVLRRTAYRYDADIDPDVGHIKKGVGLVDAFAAVHAVTDGLGTDEGVQALALTQGATTTQLHRGGPLAATGAITVSGDVAFFPAEAPTYSSTVLFFHSTPTGAGVNPTLGIAPFMFAAGEIMNVQARTITPLHGAPNPLNTTMRVVAKNLDSASVLFDRTCNVVHFSDTTLGVEEERCGTVFNVPATVASGVYEVVFTATIGASTVEAGVENVMVLGPGAEGTTLVDPGARAPATPPTLPTSGVTVRARFDAGAWTDATVAGDAWSVALTAPALGGILEIEATNGAKTVTDRLRFEGPALTIAGPASVPVGDPAAFTASVDLGGPWTFEWDSDYDGATFDVDATGATLTTSWATVGNRTVAARATSADGTLLETHAVRVVGGPTVLVSDAFAQGPAVPLSIINGDMGSLGIFNLADPQATSYDIVVPPGTSRLEVRVDWDHYGFVVDTGIVTPNDIDVWIFEDEGFTYDDYGGATGNHGEIAVVENPHAGEWRVDVTPFLVIEEDNVRVLILAYA